MNDAEERDPAPVVLVVDDDATLRILAREHLESAGFVVEEAVNGREAIDRFLSLKPDAIMMDVMMPCVDGISACAEIRRQPDAETLPILILTAHDDVVEIERAYDAGATNFATKPLNWPVELHRLQYMLRAAKVSRDLRDREGELRHP